MVRLPLLLLLLVAAVCCAPNSDNECDDLGEIMQADLSKEHPRLFKGRAILTVRKGSVECNSAYPILMHMNKKGEIKRTDWMGCIGSQWHVYTHPGEEVFPTTKVCCASSEKPEECALLDMISPDDLNKIYQSRTTSCTPPTISGRNASCLYDTPYILYKTEKGEMRTTSKLFCDSEGKGNAIDSFDRTVVETTNACCVPQPPPIVIQG